MAYKVDNIIFGAAAIYFSDLSSVDAGWTGSVDLPTFNPAEDFNTTLNSGSDFNHVGFTTEGVDVEYAPEFKDVEVDQLLDAALIYKTAQRVTINTTLAEATLENLQFVWALPSSALKAGGETAFEGDTLGADDKQLGLYEGALGEAPIERSVAFVGPGPRKAGSKTQRVYHLRRVLQTESSSHGLKRAEETMFPVSFRCLPDPAKTGSGYGAIRDRVYT